MNVKDILGMKIIDKNGKDVAKLVDFRFNIKTYKITEIYGSLGNPISKKYYEIDPNSILAIGDYMLINQTVENLSENILTKIPVKEETSTINQGLEKTVIDKEGNVAGKITNVDINTDPFEITGLVIEKSSSFGKPKNKNIINKDDILSSGDYIIINKILKEESKEDNEDDE